MTSTRPDGVRLPLSGFHGGIVRPALFTLTICCLVANTLGTWWVFATPLHYQAEITISAVGFGFIIGQVILLVIWAVLGPEPVAERFPRALGITVFIYYSWLAGAVLARNPPPMDVSVVISILVASGFAIVTTPFWIFAFATKKKIMLANQPRRIDEQFTIKSMLLWTAAIGFITALGKFLFTASDEVEGLPPLSTIWILGTMVCVISIFIVSLGLPLLLAILPARPRKWVWPVIATVFVFAPPVLLRVIYFISGNRPSSSQAGSEIVAWYGFYAAMAVFVVGVLSFVRRIGYRLATPTDIGE